MNTKLQRAILTCVKENGPCPKPVIVRRCLAALYHSRHIDTELQRLVTVGQLTFDGFNFSLTPNP